MPRTNEPQGFFAQLLAIAVAEGATAYKPADSETYYLYRHVQPEHSHASKAILFYQRDLAYWSLSLWKADHIPVGVYPIERLKGLGHV